MRPKMIRSGQSPFSVLVAVFIVLFTPMTKGEAEGKEMKALFLEGRFGSIIRDFSQPAPDTAKEERWIFLKSLILEGELNRAEEYLAELKKSAPTGAGFRVYEGMLTLARGNIVEAGNIAAELQKSAGNSDSARQLRFYYELYRRNFTEASAVLSEFRNSMSGFDKSHLFFLMSREFARIIKDFPTLSSLYRGRMKSLKKRENRDYYENLKLNYKLYKKKQAHPFRINASKDRIEIPFESGGKGMLKVVPLNIREKRYTVLLDTGNTAGWLIHSRDLREELKSVRGGRVVMQVGTESGSLDGFNIFSRSVKFEDFSIDGLFGAYLPKPRADFFDANLNPAMLTGRIVSMDYIHNRLILRSQERFDSDISGNRKMNVMKIPWFGFSYPMVPVICNGKNGLAVIETGAENISVNIDFAKKLGIPLLPRSKYLSNGKVFKYSLGAVNVQLGKYIFVRKQAEVWPLLKFRNHLTGFSPHIIIGPEALAGKFIVTFIPGENIMVFEYERKNG